MAYSNNYPFPRNLGTLFLWTSLSNYLLYPPPFTAILVIIDHFTKQVIFIPTTDTITSYELTQLFILRVFSKHGVPLHVTLDRASKFISHFWQALGKALDMRLHFT